MRIGLQISSLKKYIQTRDDTAETFRRVRCVWALLYIRGNSMFWAYSYSMRPGISMYELSLIHIYADGHVLVVSDYEPGADYVYYWGFAWDRADIKTCLLYTSS